MSVYLAFLCIKSQSKGPNYAGKVLRRHTQTMWTNKGEWGYLRSHDTKKERFCKSVLIEGGGLKKSQILTMWSV